MASASKRLTPRQIEGIADHLFWEQGWAEAKAYFLEQLRANNLPSVAPVEQERQEALGLSIDMLDADRLRIWAEKIDTHGADISHWSSPAFVVKELRRIADGVEEAVRDIGTLRLLASPSVVSEPPRPHKHEDDARVEPTATTPAQGSTARHLNRR